MSDLMPTPSINPFDTRANSGHVVHLPADMVPSWVVQKAIERGVGNSFLVNAWGGLGDQICAEPAIRYGMHTFKNVKWSLAGRVPSIYSHLEWSDVYDTRRQEPEWDRYTVFQTILPSDHILWEFISHMLVHAVDYPSLAMFRLQLPNSYKQITLPDFNTGSMAVKHVKSNRNAVVIHAGRHWPSKTFPAKWWNRVKDEMIRRDLFPVLIGRKVDAKVGYVEMDGSGSLDLRDKLTIPEFVELLKACRFLLSNDSSPIHVAAAGDAFIGMIASCKHPDFITHWRNGTFGYKTHNFGQDGLWNHTHYSPVQDEDLSGDRLPPGLIEKILPDPEYVARYYAALRDADRPTRV